MKKISILSLHMNFGGIEKSIAALANLLCDKYEVEIASIYQPFDKPAFDIDERVKIVYLNPEMTENREAFMKSFRKFNLVKCFFLGLESLKILHKKKVNTIKYIKKTDADIIISTRDILNEWSGEYAKDGVLKIGWEHNHYHDDMDYASQITHSARNLDYLVLVSKNLQKFYKNSLRKYPCKCVYVPNILDSMPKKLSPLTEKRIISVGRLSEEKGYMDLLKIYYMLHKRYPDWLLDIIGDGNQRRFLEAFIKKYKLQDYVTLHGFQKRDYIDRMFQKSSIYVMTSHTESFGIVLIEAMSHGIPCIAFNSAEGARELIESGDNGYLIKNRNFRAIIKKIEDLIEDEEERRKVGRKSRQSVKQYAGEEVVKKWYNIIEKK